MEQQMENHLIKPKSMNKTIASFNIRLYEGDHTDTIGVAYQLISNLKRKGKTKEKKTN